MSNLTCDRCLSGNHVRCRRQCNCSICRAAVPAPGVHPKLARTRNEAIAQRVRSVGRRGRRIEFHWHEMRPRLEAGLTTREVAAELGCDFSLVARKARENGYDLSDRVRLGRPLSERVRQCPHCGGVL